MVGLLLSLFPAKEGQNMYFDWQLTLACWVVISS